MCNKLKFYHSCTGVDVVFQYTSKRETPRHFKSGHEDNLFFNILVINMKLYYFCIIRQLNLNVLFIFSLTTTLHLIYFS